MTTNKLTNAQIKAAEPREKQFKLVDGGGLYVLVKTNGSKLWQMAYRLDGKQKTASFGPYPQTSLADARKAREEFRSKLKNGEIKSHTADKSETFKDVSMRWLRAQEPQLTARYARTIESRLQNYFWTDLGGKPMNQVTADDIKALLLRLEDAGRHDTAHKMRSVAVRIFRWAKARNLTSVDLKSEVEGILERRPKARNNPKLDASELPAFLTALSDYDGDDQTRWALEFVLRTMVRTKELRLAKREGEWELDGDIPLWRIPADRMKARREHLVPLPPQALELLHKMSAHSQEHLLPGARSGVISENTLLYALWRMGYKGRLTVHGLRGTASTYLHQSGKFHSEWVEAQLAHTDRDQTRAAYNAADYLQHRYEMLCWWNNRLDSKISSPPEYMS